LNYAAKQCRSSPPSNFNFLRMLCFQTKLTPNENMGTTASRLVQDSESSIVFAKGDAANGDVRRAPRHIHELRAVEKGGQNTLYALFKNGCEAHPDRPCMGFRSMDLSGTAGDFQWMTYGQVQVHVDNIGAGMLVLGLIKPNMEGVSLAPGKPDVQQRRWWSVCSLLYVTYAPTHFSTVWSAYLARIDGSGLSRSRHATPTLSPASHCMTRLVR
jgi:hypothetical protein